MYTTYILYSSTLKKFYTGHSQDFVRRLGEHNRGKTSFLKRGIPWTVVFAKEIGTRSEAIKLETSIKKRGAKRFLNEHDLDSG
jgi:putative endonuclease